MTPCGPEFGTHIHALTLINQQETVIRNTPINPHAVFLPRCRANINEKSY